MEEALVASDETDPNEAFRYWWLFFRQEAFADSGDADQPKCWLDTIVEGSRDYAKRLGERLKERIFVQIFPHLAQGFLHDRKKRLGRRGTPSDEELRDIFEATLTLLYRMLFLLYAEARDLLPMGRTAYQNASLKQIKQEIAEKAGVAESGVADKLKVYSETDTAFYDRLTKLFEVMDKGDPLLNVPCYNGGLFVTEPDPESDDREHRIAALLRDHKVPDRFLALAIDRLSRDPDEKTCGLVNIDYKSLEVRHLGSIYEGLLEFKLTIADQDLATKKVKKAEKYVPLSEVATRGKSRKSPDVAVRKGDPYLSNDKAERKATGSYYTPDPIVEYIVEHTVGPVLEEKLQALQLELEKAAKTYRRHLTNARSNHRLLPDGTDERTFAASKTYAEHNALVERVFDMKVLDPAMGSGHFLVEAVDFITDRLLDFLNRWPNNPVGFMLNKTRRSILDALDKQGVEVDPARLTDVNLLKRHVLKRCIYGVDLNPMAVELAKVSLWLDAFTLGAPLSFLDHHLRCGNSLIGATFDDLRDATSNQLFGIDYAPLMLAIRHVLFVNAMADATAAEVHKSADEYALARKALSGYQIVLDLLVADHFLKTSVKPSSLVRDTRFDVSTRETFLSGMTDNARRIVEKVEAIAHRPDLRFFHWEIEFPEVFFGFADFERRQIKHKNEITAGSAGFDAVVGNPPYDELSEHAANRELPEKSYFKNSMHFQDALGGRLNIFRLFVLHAMAVLRERGRHSFIVPMALLGDQFTAPLRKRLLSEGWLRSVAAFPQKDDPHKRVFFEAKLSTCIYVAEKYADFTRPIQITTYPGNSFHDPAKRCCISRVEIARLDSLGMGLPAISDRDLRCWEAIESFNRTAHWNEIAKCYLGELMTNASNAHLTSVDAIGPRLLRGANINYYVLLDKPKQGEPLYLREEQFLQEYANDIRSTHHTARRIGFQESSPIDNWRRLISCLIPEGHYYVHKIRYFVPDAKYDLHALLAILNARLPDWRFSLTSTNNSVNGYEIDVLPIPRFERLNVGIAETLKVDWDRWEPLLCSPAGVQKWECEVAKAMRETATLAEAWPNAIHDALAVAGREMTHLAEERQRITGEFVEWLVERLSINEDRFSGITYLHGGQADFDERHWEWFVNLLKRNRRACKTDPEKSLALIQEHYDTVVSELTIMRERFHDLNVAIDRFVWQLVGLAPDGSLPT